MPTNLPPEYFKVEQEFRAAREPSEKIRLLEELISIVPKHKGTDKLRADLRRKLSKLRSAAQARTKVARHESPYHIEPEGAGQVIVCGQANTGKSSLVRRLTNAEPEVAEYPFSTWGPTPGMVEIENVKAQLIDTPPLDRDFVEPDLVDLIRRCDLILLVVDIQDYPLEQAEAALGFLKGHRILPQGGQDGPDPGRSTSVPFLLAVNKVDGETFLADYEVFIQLLDRPLTCVPISAKTGYNLDRLRWAIFEKLEVIRVYAKPPGQEADLSAPFVIKRGSTVEDFAGQVHKDFINNLKSARVWGSSEFDGQMVSRDYELKDGDVVELKT